jgi:hypothetical protein
MNIKDSGTRRDFGTGSVRDAAEGKGRMDLLPMLALDRLYRCNKAQILRATFRDYLPDVCKTPIDRDFMDTALRLAFWYIRGYRGEPYLEGACYFAMLAMEMRERGYTRMDQMQEETGFRYEWCSWSALITLAKLYEAGCLKYGDRNWEKGQPLHIYMDSGCRHLVKHLAGWTDEDHLVAACWNFMCCLETETRINCSTLPESLADGLPSMPQSIKE